MFNYLLSVTIAFIFFGFVFNILKKLYRYTIFKSYTNDEINFMWVLVFVASLLWFFVLPATFAILIIFLLKLLTDKIADYTISKIKSRKQFKE